jgi:hypothetical protein
MAHHKDLTGRDAYVIVEALTFTIEALSGLPIEHRPDNNIADMKRLVDDFVKQVATLSVSQSIAPTGWRTSSNTLRSRVASNGPLWPLSSRYPTSLAPARVLSAADCYRSVQTSPCT